ncbi:MAG: DUF4238 domain-containing protein [Peptococcaceae bacterium]|nr:DUF4238 domain-containing protein [Peptococcaceae bacterium]
MGDITIKQHYIPQCILSNFSNNKKQVYECLINSNKIYKTHIKNSMMDSYTYEHPFFETNRIEKWFGRIESYTGPAIKQILVTIENYESGNTEFKLIRELINKYLTTFLIFYYRSGALLYEHSFGRRDKNDRILLMLEKLMNSKYLRALSRSIIQNYNFSIINSVQGEFLISDQFLSTAALSIKNRFFQISNRHMGLRDTIILIPISKKYYAVYYHGNAPQYIIPNKINSLNKLNINDINRIIINNSYRKCVSNSREAIEEALKTYEYQSPSEILAGSDKHLPFGATLKKEVFFYSRDEKAWEIITYFYHKRGMYKNIGRNDKCPCGSNQKYKKCCLEALDVAQKIIGPFAATQTYPFAPVNMSKDAVSIDAIIEMPIEEFRGK